MLKKHTTYHSKIPGSYSSDTRYPIPDTRCCCKGYKVTQKSRFTQMLVWKVVQYLCSHPLWLTRGCKVGSSVVVGLCTVKRLIINLHRYGTALYDTMEPVLNLRHNAHESVVVSLISWIIFSVLSPLARIQGKRLLVR